MLHGLFHATVDFWLTILEQTIDATDQATLCVVGHAAAALVRLHNTAADPRVVMDARRIYPAFLHDEPVQWEQWWTLDEYAQAIALRLRDLAAREPPPSIMPRVLAEWGLTGN